ncbi:uncharacterized protein LOC121823380 [Peromyscus maniculatus bairdii]|uniref:uncharacterized protein LOC121823380 n=1 Tax=Peromyscus maniculatus bairdii TaxID=230844 RepID=UPI003FD5EB30
METSAVGPQLHRLLPAPRICASETPRPRPRPSTAARPHGNSSSRSRSQLALRSDYVGRTGWTKLLLPACIARRATPMRFFFFFFHSKHRANPSMRTIAVRAHSTCGRLNETSTRPSQTAFDRSWKDVKPSATSQAVPIPAWEPPCSPP